MAAMGTDRVMDLTVSEGAPGHDEGPRHASRKLAAALASAARGSAVAPADRDAGQVRRLRRRKEEKDA